MRHLRAEHDASADLGREALVLPSVFTLGPRDLAPQGGAVMRSHLAHAGVLTSRSEGTREDFDAFCERQRSRASGLALAAHRRYVGRMLRLLERDQLDVTVSGYGIGGGPSRARDDE